MNREQRRKNRNGINILSETIAIIKNIVLRKPKLWITLWFRKEMIYLWITGVKIVLKKNNYIF